MHSFQLLIFCMKITFLDQKTKMCQYTTFGKGKCKLIMSPKPAIPKLFWATDRFHCRNPLTKMTLEMKTGFQSFSLALILTQNSDRVVVWNVPLRPPSFAISSSWYSSGSDGLDSQGVFTKWVAGPLFRRPGLLWSGRTAGTLLKARTSDGAPAGERWLSLFHPSSNIWNMSHIPTFTRRPHSRDFIDQLENSCHFLWSDRVHWAGWISFNSW